MPEYLTRDADGVTADVAERRIDVRLLAYGEVADRTAEGIKERFAPGAFANADPSRVTLESMRHGGPIVGAAESIKDVDGAPVATFRVANTPAGDELLALASPGPNGEAPILRAASVTFAPIKSRQLAGGVTERQSVDLASVAILPRGAYPSAQVMAVREAALPEETPVSDPVDIAPITSAIQAVETRMAALEALQAMPSGQAASPLSRFASAGEFLKAAYYDDTLSRALASDTAANSAGVMPPQWLQEVKGIIDLGRRAITAMGGAEDVGPSGLETDWPSYSGTLTGIVATQATANTEIQSAAINFTKSTATLAVYAGGGSIDQRLIDRSSPDYLSNWLKVAGAAYGYVTDSAFGSQLVSASTSSVSLRTLFNGTALTGSSTAAASDDIFRITSHGLAVGDAITVLTKTGGTGITLGAVYWVISSNFASGTFQVGATPGATTAVDITVDMTAYTVAKLTDDGSILRQRLFEASVQCENATGQPTRALLASTDWFLAMAGMSKVVTTAIPGGTTNPYNAAGVANADSLRVNVSGLDVVRCPGLTAGTVISSNSLAARWREDGPRTITATDVTNLAQQKAVYGYGVTAAYLPAGIVKSAAV